MKPFMATLIKSLFSLVLLTSGFVCSVIAQTAVPVDKEPSHSLKFENEFVRVFEVFLPSGQMSQFHTHVCDGVSIRLSDSVLIDEAANSEKTPLDMKFGVASFGAQPSPTTHRIINNGKTDFRNLFVEILPTNNAAAATTMPKLSDRHIILIDNSRVRINRLVLKPGESSKLHTHAKHGLGVILFDSKFEISGPDGTKRTIESKAGDFIWQDAGTRHMIKNVGTKNFEAIDIEIK